MHVLLVEDDRAVAEPLQRGLARYGYDVTWVSTGQDAFAARTPDLVLLDLGLPDIDGLDVCRELRARGDVPVIMISGRDSETEKVVGLELGADDYIVKPFLVRELIARIRAVLRRPRTGDGRLHRQCDTYGRVTVDRRAHRAFLDGVEQLARPDQDPRHPCDGPAPQAR